MSYREDVAKEIEEFEKTHQMVYPGSSVDSPANIGRYFIDNFDDFPVIRRLLHTPSGLEFQVIKDFNKEGGNTIEVKTPPIVNKAKPFEGCPDSCENIIDCKIPTGCCLERPKSNSYTPFLLSSDKLIIPPKDGWKPNTYYEVDVSYNKGNPIHKAILGVGFISLDNPGEPGNYSILFSMGYDYPVPFARVHYLRAIKELFRDIPGK